jgi:hypothetical protein
MAWPGGEDGFVPLESRRNGAVRHGAGAVSVVLNGMMIMVCTGSVRASTVGARMGQNNVPQGCHGARFRRSTP